MSCISSLFTEHLISNGDGDKKQEKKKEKEVCIRHHKYANGEDLEGEEDTHRDRQNGVSVGKNDERIINWSAWHHMIRVSVLQVEDEVHAQEEEEDVRE